jgi:AmmeMemoRadiSam system protein B/AmmeMemoRadiSam system protein A
MTLVLSWILLIFVSLTTACSKKSEPMPLEVVHTSQLSDAWYNHNKQILENEIEDYFTLAAKQFTLAPQKHHASVLVVPHAGYWYSGLCAASAYQSLRLDGTSVTRNKNTAIKRVIILSPCHSTFYRGVALPDYTIYKTVFGSIPVDTAAIKTLSQHHLFNIAPDLHRQEHGIEMQLPFLQKTVAQFQIIPLIFGKLSDEDALVIADKIAGIIDETTLVVVSSDLTHHGKRYDYEPFSKDIARNITRLDSLAIQSLCIPSSEAFNTLLEETHATICGQEPLRVMLHLLEGNAYGEVEPEVTSYYSSAQVYAARPEEKPWALEKLYLQPADSAVTNVVSYVGLIYRRQGVTERSQTPALNGYEKQSLLTLARQSINNYFLANDEGKVTESLLFPVITPRLEESCGVFCSLKWNDDNRLRGCIGTIERGSPLYKATHDMSIGAAFGDQRFLPLAPGEARNTHLELSLLSPIHAVQNIQDIKLGKHGIILKKHNQEGVCIGSALFLPNVAREMEWTLEETLSELSNKAGLPEDSWKKNCTFYIFETNEIKE